MEKPLQSVKSWRPKVSHGWLLLCNLAIFAMTICVLASCRTPSESSYSMLNIDKKLMRQTLGDECYGNFMAFRPDSYRVGLSGSCKVEDGSTSCESHGPRVNWISVLETDIANANVSDSQGAVLDKCVQTLNDRGPDRDFTDRLAKAIFALLIISILLNVSALAAAVYFGSGFAMPVFIIGLIDEMILVTCAGIFIGLMNHEVGQYIPSTTALRDIDDIAVLGVGFWLLIAVVGVRAISHPLLFVITLVVALLVVLIPVLLLLACCLGSDSREKTVVYVRERVDYVVRADDRPDESRW